MGEAEDRPWERPGAVRRDCQPHRGLLLMILGHAGLLWAGLGCLYGLSTVVSLPLSITAWVLARRDLAKMDAGEMDARGMEGTLSGWRCGAGGTFVSLAWLAFWGVVLLSVLWQQPVAGPAAR